MKISIITVAKNSENTIKETFESVLRQGYPDLDYIVIDGASTDKTLEITESYRDKFNGAMRVVSEPDNGIYDAMNKGIALARGEVIGILNSDDFFTSDDALKTVAEEIGIFDALYGDIHFVSRDDLKHSKRYYSSKIFRPWLLRFGFAPAHPAFFLKKSCYEKFGCYAADLRLSADFDMFARLFGKHRINAKYVEKDFVTMRLGGASTQSLAAHLECTGEIVKSLKKLGIYSNSFFCSFRFPIKFFQLFHR